MGGGIDNFVAMMNNEAAAIGCTGTTFGSLRPEPQQHHTTARDAYLILRALTAYDVFFTVAGTPDLRHGHQQPLHNTWHLYFAEHRQTHHQQQQNRGLPQGRQDRQPWRMAELCGLAQSDGESYISVVLNVPMESDEGGRPCPCLRPAP